jgi:hypothetical protein
MIYGALLVTITTKKGTRYVCVKSANGFMSYVYSHALSDTENALSAAKVYAGEKGWVSYGDLHLGAMPGKGGSFVAVFDGVRS